MVQVKSGNRVWVNIAPFIGWLDRGRSSVLCKVLQVSHDSVLVRTEGPCREFSIRIAPEWIDAKAADGLQSPLPV